MQNAADQARAVAARLAGRTVKFDAVPWFWTEQFTTKLQIAGLVPDTDAETVRVGDAEDAFSVLHFRNGRLAAVESVNRPNDHVAARRLLAQNVPLQPEDTRIPKFRLSDATTVQTG